MNWTDYKPGQNVEVWTYANEPTVELFLNGRLAGREVVRPARRRRRACSYLETTRVHQRRQAATPRGACPAATRARTAARASCTSPGRAVRARAARGGGQGRRRQGRRARRGRHRGRAVRPEADRRTRRAAAPTASRCPTSTSMSSTPRRRGARRRQPGEFAVTGAGTFAGADNGKQDDAEGYKSPTHDAFNGKLLSIVQAVTDRGRSRHGVRRRAAGAAMTLRAGDRAGRGHGPRAHSILLPRSHRALPPAWRQTHRPPTRASPAACSPTAARTSGRARRCRRRCSTATPATFWSNRYSKGATQTLPQISNSHPRDWVSVAGERRDRSTRSSRCSGRRQRPVAGDGHRVVLGRQLVEAREQSEHSVCRQLRRAVVDHVRTGYDDEAQARHDQRFAQRSGDRQPRDRRAANPRCDLDRRSDMW